MDERSTFVPPHVIDEIEALVLATDMTRRGSQAEIADELVRRGYAKSRRTGIRWVKAVYDGTYRTRTGEAHLYTPPPDKTPQRLIAELVSTQKRALRTLLNKYEQSGDDVYAVVTGDWHAPDEDPVAMELAMQVAEAWVAGQRNKLMFNNGDYACFPTLHKNNVVPRQGE